MRTVVLLCGPTGAGKTTLARESGLTVYDRDDPQWLSERHFTAALECIATDSHARAVVIRSGATSSARARAARLVRATHTFVVTAADRDELARRIRQRARGDEGRTSASLDRWFDRFDDDDHVLSFASWPAVLEPTSVMGVTSL
jgi:ribose 1,5-bisphosphokinase PhnN